MRTQASAPCTETWRSKGDHFIRTSGKVACMLDVSWQKPRAKFSERNRSTSTIAKRNNYYAFSYELPSRGINLLLLLLIQQKNNNNNNKKTQAVAGKG